MVEDNNASEAIADSQFIIQNETLMKLVSDMLAGKIIEITPELDFANEMGFVYPVLEQNTDIKGSEAVSILESFVIAGILKKNFFDRLLHCPYCDSVNLRPTIHCPKCGSGNIVRGRILEHNACGYAGMEDNFVSGGRYICPKCKMSLQTIGTDYLSLGLMRQCLNCDEIFVSPSLKWRCLKCSSIITEDKISEANIFSYSFNEEKRGWLEFELRPKAQLIEFLRQRGYDVTENAVKKGRSGAGHKIAILATRDDGIITHNIAIGVKVTGGELSLKDIFEFDDTVYDTGIHDKVLVAIPGLGKEAETFAHQQRIKVLKSGENFEAILSGAAPTQEVAAAPEPFEFKSKSHLVEYLRQRGYEIEENATVKGKSGAEHRIDVLATRNDGIVELHIAIGLETSDQPVELGRVFDFDDKAYDIGIQDKIFIAAPGLSREARQFADRQRIKVFEVAKLD